jgi:hypothetical protein
MTSPVALIAAAAGAGVVLLGGLPLVVAPLGAAVGWTARVALAVPRGGRRERIDPFTLGEPWRRFVQGALQARARVSEGARRPPPGPLRDRLGEIGERVEVAVHEVWRIAQRGHALSQARRNLDPDAIRRQLAQLEAAGPTVDEVGPPDALASYEPGTIEPVASPHDATLRALRAQLETVERMDRVIDDSHARLRLLGARLDEAVARMLELSVHHAGDPASLGGLGADVEGVVADMEALRQALDEVGGPDTGPDAGPGAGPR